MQADEREPTVVLAVGGQEARWPLPTRVRVSVVDIDVLARLALAARRAGGELRVEGPPPPLGALLDLCGLRGVLAPGPLGSGSSVEVGGEPEGLEQAGVDEAVVADDPVA